MSDRKLTIITVTDVNYIGAYIGTMCKIQGSLFAQESDITDAETYICGMTDMTDPTTITHIDITTPHPMWDNELEGLREELVDF